MTTANPPLPPFYCQKAIDKVENFAHHSSVSALWETKWKFPCSIGIYPFVQAKVEDFEPIFHQLAKTSNDNVDILSDPDAYAQHFLPVGKKLSNAAKVAEDQGDIETARDLYLRAAAVFRIARFPINRSKITQEAWRLNKEAFSKGAQYLDPPYFDVAIPFKYVNTVAGDRDEPIQVNVRIPKGDQPSGGWPIILILCGLDGYKTDLTDLVDRHIQAGFAVICVEIPGTADSPAAPNDPESCDRVWNSVFDWISAYASHYRLNGNRIIARGLSTGGYYAVRIAHTHAARLIGAICHGGFSHYALSPEWARAMNHMEYPFGLGDAVAYKLGYNSVEEMIADDAQSKFSLDKDHFLDGPSCRLLLVNGMEDSIFPIEDSILVACRGRAKDVRFVEGNSHMGNPQADKIVLDWINDLVANK